MPDEIADPLKDFIGEIASGVGMDSATVIKMLDSSYDIDVTEVSHDDAEEFVDAFEDGDKERVGDVLDKYDVADRHQEKLFDEMEFIEKEGGVDQSDDDADTDVSENGETPGVERERASMGADEVEQLIDQKVQQATPDADEIAARLEERLAGGGGGQQGQNPQTAGANQQQQMALQLASQFLNDDGPSQAEKMGQMFQNKAMENAMSKLFAPDPFDIMRKRWAIKQAEKWGDDDEMQEMMEMMDMDMDPDEVSEPDDEKSGWFSW